MATAVEIYERRPRTRVNSTTDTITNENTDPLKNQSMPGILPTSKMAAVSAVRKTLSVSNMLFLNAVVCGVEICACAGFTYIPPMLLKAGYLEENMSIILGVGPLLGFFLVPVIGNASDRLTTIWGKRRPFIFVLSMILIFALIIVPYGDFICFSVFGKNDFSRTLSLISLTFGVVMLDFTSQACLTPCEALLSDVSKDTDQHERIFTFYSIMVSLGGIIGYLITALDWNSLRIGMYLGSQERCVFTLLVILFTLLLAATLMTADEKSSVGGEGALHLLTDDSKGHVMNGGIESGYDTSSNSSEDGVVLLGTLTSEQGLSNSSFTTTRTTYLMNKLSTYFKFLLRFKLFSAFYNIGKLFCSTIYEKLPDPLKRLLEVPFVLRHLAAANFCSWTAVMGFNLFFTDYVGNVVYQGNPNAEENSYLRDRFDEGVRMASWGLLLHCITSIVYAFFVERLVDRYGCRLTYLFGMMSFCCAMFGIVLVDNIIFVNTMAALTGIGYATLTTIPFILVTKYHAKKELYFSDTIQPGISGNKPPLLPARGIATDMGMMDSAYFLSQVVLSGLMGYVVHITGSVVSYMVTAGVMGVVACIFIQNIVINSQDMVKYLQGRKGVIEL
ncbi:hypothetical protein CHS0354_024467 [Potamilus streckersoni]|uniref:Solute carrier family 45 member 3 n=1 Tax=Potamilus streckersoni TaxID=2493646 RepID=A0AAE0WHG6_9BIVA|nr:hypothetical protein CHS0354_024467 [Potamilus streckersoni]